MTEPKSPPAAEAQDGQATRPPAATAAAGTPRWMRVALILSLTLNLLVLGVIGGAALRFWRNPPRPPIAEVGFGPYTEALDPADRRALRDAFVSKMPGLRDLRRESREDVRELVAVLRADPWDPAAARAVLAGRADRTRERLELGQALFLDRLDTMSPADRQALAARLEEMLRRPLAHVGGHKDGERSGQSD